MKPFFRRSPETKGLFVDVSMDRQYKMIDDAIKELLSVRHGAQPTTLSGAREVHRAFQLTPADFDHFRDAFLETLKEMGESDPEVLKSWRAALRPGLDYMKQVCGQKGPPKPERARRSSSKAVRATPPTQPLPHAAEDGAKAHG